jgi:hypothetical protein
MGLLVVRKPPGQRPLHSIPRWIIVGVPVLLCLQILWRAAQPDPHEHVTALPAPPTLTDLRIASLDDPIALAKILMLWLQAYDNQPGVSIPFRDLDFAMVKRWLQRILDLDPRAQYPLLAASRLYAETPVEPKQRLMLEFIHEQFLLAPNQRWPWLAHAVFIAKHRLHDLPLALRYARSLATQATASTVPHWAKQMHIFVLEDIGEIAGARILLKALLDSGQITDPNELRFLQARLQALEVR